MQSHSKCLVKHILLGQNIVSSVRAWAYKIPTANGEVQHWQTLSHVHPVKPGIAAGPCRHGVIWFSSRTPCAGEPESTRRVIASALNCNTSLNEVQCGLLWWKHREFTWSPWFLWFGHVQTLWHCCRFHPKLSWIHHRTSLQIFIPKFTAFLSRANPLVNAPWAAPSYPFQVVALDSRSPRTERTHALVAVTGQPFQLQV